MGYYPTDSALADGKRTAAFQPVGPTLLRPSGYAGQETVTPGLQVQDRGHRFYNPEVGRWVNRDPIGEKGGNNYYVFCRNAPFSTTDVLGMWDWTWTFDDGGQRSLPSPEWDPITQQYIQKRGESSVALGAIGYISEQFYRCCKIDARGEGFGKILWWADISARNHEMTHVNLTRIRYEALKNEVGVYAPSGWMKCSAAECYIQLIGLISRIQEKSNYRNNKRYDCNQYGNLLGACDRADEAAQEVMQLEHERAVKVQQCSGL